MKSIYSKFLSLAMVTLAFVGCQENEIDSTFIPEGNGFTLVATTASQTRISLSDNSSEQNIEVTWADDDSFSLYDSEGAYVARFYYTGDNGATTGEFIGEGIIFLTDGQSYTAIYPYLEGDEALSLTEREAIALNNTTQSEDASLEHIANELRMSAEFSYIASDSAMSINFAHDFSMLKLSFSLEENITPTQLIFSDGDVDYTLLYADDYAYTSGYTSYMVIAPSPENSGERTLSFTLTTSSDEVQEYSTTITNDLVAGKCYTANLAAIPPVGAFALADFSAESYPVDSDEWTIWNTSAELDAFYGLRDALYSADDAGREILLIFPNLEEIPSANSNADGAFYDCDALTSVELPAATEIGGFAFAYCGALTSVELPVATVIGNNAFTYCYALTTVELPAVTEIGSSAFYGCYVLTTVELPVATVIGSEAFCYCTALTTLNIPSSVTEIGGGAFSGCDKLTTLNLYTSHYILENGIVYSSDKSNIISALQAIFLDSAYYSSTVITVLDHAFSDCDALTTVELPVATSIGRWAFYHCDALTTVELPAATEICGFAFKSCDALTTMSIATADNVVLSSIDSSAFSNTTTTAITLTLGLANSDYVSGNILTVGDFSAEFKEIILVDGDSGIKTYSTLADFSSTSYPTDTDTWTITDTSAELDAFYGLRDALYAAEEEKREISLIFSNLESVPDTTDYMYSAFYNCAAITSLEMPVATSIGGYAFILCDGLTSIELPEATSIGLCSFRYCDALTSIELPMATSIGICAFSDSDNIASVKLPVATSIGGSAFYDCNALTSVELPAATSIDNYAFQSCNALTSIEFPEVILIGNYAFYGCDALTSVELPAVTSIDVCAFYDCDALTSVELPAAVSLGDGVFKDCTTLSSLSIATDENVVLSSVHSDLFSGTTTTDITLTLGSANSNYVSGNTLTFGSFSEDFKEIILVDGDGNVVTPAEPFSTLADFSADSYPTDTDTWTINDTSADTADFAGLSAAIEALADSGRQISLEFPNLDAIPDYAIFGVDGIDWEYVSAVLVSVSADAATSVGDYAFHWCYALTTVELPAVTEIGDYAFRDCDALTSVELPVATSIGDYAFAGCDVLTSIALPMATSIGDYAFDNSDALASVELPVATEIGSYAFQYCDALASMSIATDDNVVLSSIDSNAFYYIATTNITLTLGSANSGYVSGNTLTVGSYSWTFKEIVLVDGDGNVVVPDVPDAGGSVEDAIITSCDDDLTFVLSSCEESVSGIKVNFTVTNSGSSSESLTLYTSSSYAYDDQGSYNSLYNVSLADSYSSSNVTASIASGASVTGYIIVEDVSSLASEFTYFSVKTGYGYNLIIKNLPIANRSASSLPAATTTGTIVSCSDDIEFELLGCQSSTAGMKVSYRMKNTSSSLVYFTQYVNSSYAYDDRGTYYSLKSVSLGDMSTNTSYRELYLPPNVYVNGYFIIEDVSDLSATFDYISLKTNFTEQIVMKNVDIEGVEATALPSATTSGTIVSCSDDIEFELLGCQSSTAGMKVSYRMKNTSSSLVYFTQYVNSSYAYDDRGTYYSLKSVSLGDMSTNTSYRELYLPPNVYVNGYFIIEDVSDLSATFDYISLKTNFTEQIVMKNVDIEGVEATALPSATTSGAVTSCSDDIEFEVLSCQSSVSGMKLSYRMKNVSSSLVYFTQYVNSSYVYDNEGNYCALKSVSLGDMSTNTSYRELYLPPGVYVNGYVIIDGVSDSATELTSGSFRTNFTYNITIANIAIE